MVVLDSEEELDSKLKDDAAKLIVLLSTVTWCRPCKTLKRPLEVPVCPIFMAIIILISHIANLFLAIKQYYQYRFSSFQFEFVFPLGISSSHFSKKFVIHIIEVLQHENTCGK